MSTGRARVRKLRRMARTIDPRVDIGHVHLKVSDIDRALRFYRDVLGFDVTQRYGGEAFDAKRDELTRGYSGSTQDVRA